MYHLRRASKSLIFYSTVGLISCGEQHNTSSIDGIKKIQDMPPSVVYGTDDRLDLYQVSDSQQLAWADSTVAVISEDSLIANGPGEIAIKGELYGESRRLCSDEPFYKQTAASWCSGTLVGPDLVLTAGHCLNESNCSTTKFIFGFGYKTQNSNPYVQPEAEIYSCKEIVVTHQVNDGADYALIRLDRTVPNHQPAAIRRQGLAQVEQEIVVIGHPRGLPTKVGRGKIRSIETDYYVTTLDTYQGHSGSGVFDATTGQVEGVLVRGEVDFEYSNNDQCYRSKVCDEAACRGEDVTKVSTFLADLDRALQL